MSLRASLQVVASTSSAALWMLCQLTSVYMLGYRMTEYIVVALAIALRVWASRW